MGYVKLKVYHKINSLVEHYFLVGLFIKISVSYKTLLVYPILRMIEHWRMSCGADSKNASISPDLTGLCFKASIRTLFWMKLGSIVANATNTLKFLKTKALVNDVTLPEG